MPAIRIAEMQDALAMSALHHRCFDAGWAASVFTTFFESGRAIAFVAEEEQRLIGMILCTHIVGEAEIMTLAVDAAHGRQGIASSLIEKACRSLEQLGVGRIMLEVNVNNDAAQRLYQRCGFVSMGRRKGYYRGANGRPTEDALTLQKQLGAQNA